MCWVYTFGLISHNSTAEIIHPTISVNLHRSISIMPVNHHPDDESQRIPIFPPTLIHDTPTSCTLHNSFNHFNSTTLMCSNPCHRKSVYRKPLLLLTYTSLPPVCPSVTSHSATSSHAPNLFNMSPTSPHASSPWPAPTHGAHCAGKQVPPERTHSRLPQT